VAPLFGNITSEVRELCATTEVYKNAVARAIVVKNIATRLFGCFFIRINKPPAPIKMCATEEAYTWLKEIIMANLPEKPLI